MQPGETKYFGNYFIQCDAITDPSGESQVIWRVGEEVEGRMRRSSDAGPKSYEEAVDWVAAQQSR